MAKKHFLQKIELNMSLKEEQLLCKHINQKIYQKNQLEADRIFEIPTTVEVGQDYINHNRQPTKVFVPEP